MLNEIGYNRPENGSLLEMMAETKKLYMVLKDCYDEYSKFVGEFLNNEDGPYEVSTKYGVEIHESSSIIFHELTIIIPDEMNDTELMLIAAQIINEYDFWGWPDTDPVGWKIEINNGFHYDRAVSSIKITLEDWAS